MSFQKDISFWREMSSSVTSCSDAFFSNSSKEDGRDEGGRDLLGRDGGEHVILRRDGGGRVLVLEEDAHSSDAIKADTTQEEDAAEGVASSSSLSVRPPPARRRSRTPGETPSLPLW